jgi:hypothetical protein
MILKSILRIAMVVLGASFAAFAQDADPDFKCLAFEKNTTEYKNRLYLVISGDSIGGNQSLEYDDGAEPGAVEQLMKLGKGEIAITEGELEEHGPNQKTLKDPKNVPFTKIFKQVPLSLPELESKEAAVVLKPVHALVEKLTGCKCDLSGGRLRVAGDAALFQGFVREPVDKKPSDPKIAAMMAEGEFQVFLKKANQGWVVARSGFLPIYGSTSDYQSITEEDAPWQFLNGGEMH